MQNHRLYNTWSKVPVNYYQNGVKNNFFQWLWHDTKIKLAKKIIKDLEFNNCLDVGCASGFMVSEIAKAFPGASYYGVDVYDKAIDSAKKTYPGIDFKIASAERIPYKKTFFDLILFYETIEHVEKPDKCLKEIRRVLKENGTLILTMDSGSLLFRIVWFIWENTKGRVWRNAHLHPFHHNQLEDLIKKSGFIIQDKIFSFLGMEVTFVLSNSSKRSGPTLPPGLTL
ncbi:class I SAM-dependent methyltransferase [Candidatus Daviesbacteria bacterium]|nr:class I SAM-dependent methyltransferase [Candidatus Daviesbacteria bacterium]